MTARYRYSNEKKTTIYQQIEKMLEDRIIEPSTSEFASPIVVVKKKDGQPRFCVDYRRLNSQTVDEATPLPRIQETLRDLGQAMVFTTFDLRSGYWQVAMEEASKKYTAFSTPDGALFQFQVMPFGLKGAPATFQRLTTQEVLPGYLRSFTLVYLDDIIIYSPDYNTHLAHLRLVFERLAIHGLRCAPRKCNLGKRELEYLGHVVGPYGNRPQECHLHQIATAEPPTDRKRLRSFLGTCSWLREYVSRFAEIAQPLTDLLGNQKKWKWGPAENDAFLAIKRALAAPLPLHRPDPTRPYVLQTDASSIGMAAVLYQEVDQQRHVIAYASSRFNATEQKYHSNEQECLALVWGIRKYRPYLEDRRFLVRTDNKALTWPQSAKDGKAKLTRWALELQQYNFGPEHCPGKENELPDFLSRNPEAQEPNDPLDADDTERLLSPERRADSLRPTACPADIALDADNHDTSENDGRNAPFTEGTNINDADEPDITLAGEVRAAQQREPHTHELISLRRKLDHDPPVVD
jgi:hypothetical protein